MPLKGMNDVNDLSDERYCVNDKCEKFGINLL